MAVPASVVAITVVRPGATPIKNKLVGEAGCTRAIAGSADMTVAAACGRRKSMPVPAWTDTAWRCVAVDGLAAGSGVASGGTDWPPGATAPAGIARRPQTTNTENMQPKRFTDGAPV